MARFSVCVGSPGARGCSVGLSGMYRAIHDVFHNHGTHKIWLTVHVENIAAIRAYQRLGFQLEEYIGNAFLLQGRRMAAFYMGLLSSDFDRLEVI